MNTPAQAATISSRTSIALPLVVSLVTGGLVAAMGYATVLADVRYTRQDLSRHEEDLRKAKENIGTLNSTSEVVQTKLESMDKKLDRIEAHILNSRQEHVQPQRATYRQSR